MMSLSGEDKVEIANIYQQTITSADDVPITETTELGDVDSLDKTELILELETHFDISISDEEANAAKTIGDIYKLVAKHKS